MWSFVAVSYIAQFATSIIFHVLSKAIVGPGVQNELQDPKGIFRPMNDVRMVYPLLGAPFINSIVLWNLRSLLRAPFNDGVTLALAVWLVGSAHGIFIQWTSNKVSFAATLHFLASTCALAVVNGWVLTSFF